jgi:hypothetical protein
MADTALTAYLWDLRAQAESKLRCLTRVQQLLAQLENTKDPAKRVIARTKILDDLTDIVSISKSLRTLAEDALSAAQSLPE